MEDHLIEALFGDLERREARNQAYQAKIDEQFEFENAQVDLNSAPRGPASPASNPDVERRLNRVQPIVQQKDYTCGAAACASAINFFTGGSQDDLDFEQDNGLNLLYGLNKGTSESGVTWRDAGNVGEGNIDETIEKLRKGYPVVIGLNGPKFSPSGRGHIVTLTGADEEGNITYADSADGTIKTTNRQELLEAESHPCLLYTSPSPRDQRGSRMPSSA